MAYWEIMLIMLACYAGVIGGAILTTLLIWKHKDKQSAEKFAEELDFLDQQWERLIGN